MADLTELRRKWLALAKSDVQAKQSELTFKRIDGWLRAIELLEGGVQAAAVQEWLATFPHHPAASRVRRLRNHSSSIAASLHTIAVLLPLSGEYRLVGLALQAGIKDARQTLGNKAPNLYFLDSAPAFDDALLNLKKLVEDDDKDIDGIIGPLLKTNVDTFLDKNWSVPVLLLNDPASGRPVPIMMYRFALWPQDEVKAMVEMAWNDGWRCAAAVYPDDNWGRRLLTVLQQQWSARGGCWAEARAFEPQATHFGEILGDLFGVDTASEQPQPQHAFDVLFMLASHRQAKMLRPQIQFWHPQTLPVYANAKAYRPGDRTSLKDLAPLFMADMPAIVAADAGPLTRFEAMGRDALQVALALFTGAESFKPTSAAALFVQPGGRVQRRLWPIRIDEDGPDAVCRLPVKGN